jgi:hypothetical protein
VDGQDFKDFCAGSLVLFPPGSISVNKVFFSVNPGRVLVLNHYSIQGVPKVRLDV